MGKLDHDPHIQHFSHPHPLELSNFQDNTITQNTPICSSCKYPQSGYMYSCNLCNFHIHLSCTQFPQLITHPSHPTHALTLLPVSNYPGGQFNCDACNRRGNGFSYHCHHCDFDLHVVCASKPLSITHQSHAHTLGLAFRNPYETKGFSCDICKKIASKQWLYRCGACEFDAHLECATGTPPPPVPPPKPAAQPPQLLQTHHHSFPGANVPQNQFQTPVAGRLNNYYAHSASTGSLLQQPVPPLQPPAPQQQSYTAAGANSSMGSGLMNAVLQGLVEGAAQQVGQNVMNSLIGGGGGGSGGGNGDGSSGSIFVDVGPSYVIED